MLLKSMGHKESDTTKQLNKNKVNNGKSLWEGIWEFAVLPAQFSRSVTSNSGTPWTV